MKVTGIKTEQVADLERVQREAQTGVADLKVAQKMVRH